MNLTPNSREQYSAHIPALHLLCNLGWNRPATPKYDLLRYNKGNTTATPLLLYAQPWRSFLLCGRF